MRVIYSEDHKLRDAKTELHGGLLVKPFEGPFRAEWILQAVVEEGFADVVAPQSYGLETAEKVHDSDYLSFLETVWDRWVAEGYEGEVIPTAIPYRRARQVKPRAIDGLVGYYANAIETAITQGTYKAAISSMNVALTGVDWINAGNRFCFSLCRPPGHHAGIDLYGGYCFINNAAVAAQRFLDHGAKKVAILDVDFHHGNGTQDIFYRRGDVLFASLHGDPADAFPYYLGFADEKGEGAGEGSNHNYPMLPGTAWDVWSQALDDSLAKIKAFGADPKALMPKGKWPDDVFDWVVVLRFDHAGQLIPGSPHIMQEKLPG